MSLLLFSVAANGSSIARIAGLALPNPNGKAKPTVAVTVLVLVQS